MRIAKIKVRNFRLLTDLTMELEENLSLIIGKNNTGKTSLVHVLDKFLNNRDFAFEDFNVNLCTNLIDSIEVDLKKGKLDPIDYKPHKINLQIFIEYSDSDDLSRISRFIMDLDPDKYVLLLSFDYLLRFEKYQKLVEDFKSHHTRINQRRKADSTTGKTRIRRKRSQLRKLEDFRGRRKRNLRRATNFSSFTPTEKSITREDIHSFIKEHHAHYFEKQRMSLDVDDNEHSHDISHDDVREIIGLQIIDAKRDVANTEGAAGKTLSKLSSKYYKTQDKSGPNDPPSVTDLQLQLTQTDADLTQLYSRLFEPVINSVRKFAPVTNDDEAELTIQSLLRESSLFEENTFVSYQHGSYRLPESYSGLGYMNLFSIIFDIHIKLGHLKKISSASDKPAEINLLCIEEPEAHTHPQMQYVFIKNIKALLDDEGRRELKLQTIMTTHSSHIVSQSDFDDIKYFYRVDKNTANIKNMKDLAKTYADADKFAYLKKYLTLNNSELFFADKAVFIEGTTERILLPTMMRMIDKYNEHKTGYFPLLSQNVSVVEVGNYAHVFDEFLRFLEIKTLVITDIDAIDNKGKTCEVRSGRGTSNGSLKHYFNGCDFDHMKYLRREQKILTWQEDQYVSDEYGKLFIAFQIQENGYHARSFEDAFLACNSNLDFIVNHCDEFISLKNRDELRKKPANFFEIAEQCIEKKSSFASDILYHTDSAFTRWSIPAYIKEGLKWLAE